MDIPRSILSCLCDADDHWPARLAPSSNFHQYTHHRPMLVDSKPHIQYPPSPGYSDKPIRSNDEIAADVVRILRQAKTLDDEDVKSQVQDAIGPAGWSEWLAEKTLHTLEEVLKDGRPTWGEWLAQAYDDSLKVVEDVFCGLVEYARVHPLEVAASVLVTLLAFGVLVRLVPVVLELLGFGVEGPVEGSFAAWWESMYNGFVPKGSLFSYLQRLGMVWRATLEARKAALV